jgi:outer membrane scaffolding protein for murein synthesis (MipA/OmpV family)
LPLTESQGVLYNIGLNVVLFNNDSDTLTVSTIRNYGDARYNNTWFGGAKSKVQIQDLNSLIPTRG